jgi:ATP-dependent DNA helicase RecQ
MEMRFDFDLPRFADQYKFRHVTVYNSLKFLEKEGLVMVSEAFHNPSKIYITAGKEDLYRFQVEHAALDHFIKTLLRSYSGILSGFVTFNEAELGKRMNLPVEEVIRTLEHLEKLKLLDYLRQTDKPQLIFLNERINSRDISLSTENYRDRLRDATRRTEAVIGYAGKSGVCRSQALLAYFGETGIRRCGKCDVCIERNKISINELEMNNIIALLQPLLRQGPCSLEEMVETCGSIGEEKVIGAIRWLLDNERLQVDENQKYCWSE